ncbi:MAG: transposase [Flammeovirgaceae bacterium]|nr:MAG: transposase [Flammeovirgaceae bacterium]
MKRTRFTEVQIFNILKEFDAGKNIQDIARDQGISKCKLPLFRTTLN